MTDVLIDDEKFAYMSKNMYDAMDDDSEGTLKCNLVETFFREFLAGT